MLRDPPVARPIENGHPDRHRQARADLPLGLADEPGGGFHLPPGVRRGPLHLVFEGEGREEVEVLVLHLPDDPDHPSSPRLRSDDDRRRGRVDNHLQLRLDLIHVRREEPSLAVPRPDGKEILAVPRGPVRDRQLVRGRVARVLPAEPPVGRDVEVDLRDPVQRRPIRDVERDPEGGIVKVDRASFGRLGGRRGPGRRGDRGHEQSDEQGNARPESPSPCPNRRRFRHSRPPGSALDRLVSSRPNSSRSVLTSRRAGDDRSFSAATRFQRVYRPGRFCRLR